jgi:hypothetical protein
MVFSARNVYLYVFIRNHYGLVGFHECLVLFFLHLLKHLLVVRQPSLSDDLADLSLDPSTYHAVYGVLLSLDGFLLGFFFVIGVYSGVEGKLLYRLLVLHF